MTSLLLIKIDSVIFVVTILWLEPLIGKLCFHSHYHFRFNTIVQEHSSLLIEKLSNDKTLDLNGNQNQLGDELNEDICQLLSQYDVKLKLKRDIIRDQLIENHHENSVKLAQSYRRKEDQHQSLFRQLEIQVRMVVADIWRQRYFIISYYSSSISSYFIYIK